jgi:PKD repeat protein
MMMGIRRTQAVPRGRTAGLLVGVFLLGVMAVTVIPGQMGPAMASGNGGAALPDLFIEELYNVTPVVEGDFNYFNVTIRNLGTAAYLLRKSGELEVYGYRDSETQVAVLEKVNDDIYINETFTMNLEVYFPEEGHHSLRVVLDEMNKVRETDEGNNEATVEFEVEEYWENRPPKADGGNDRTGYVGQPVLFTAMYSSDPDDDELTYTWDYGDGTTGSGVTTEHIFIALGDFRAILRVSDGKLSDTDTFTVHIIDAPKNNPPVAVIQVAGTEVEAGQELSLDGKGSSDPDLSDTLVFKWDFDSSDGVDDWILGPSVISSWDEPGEYTVTLRVSDGKAHDIDTVAITVVRAPPPNMAPNANAGSDIKVAVDEDFTIVGSGDDPDGSIEVYEWDVDNDGVYDTYSEVDGALLWSFDAVGLWTLKLRVTDDGGKVAEDTVVVEVKVRESRDKDAPGPSALLTIVAFIITTALISRLKGYAGGGPKDEKHGPSFK